MIKIKGNEIEAPNIKNSFDRRAIQIQNNIINTLHIMEQMTDVERSLPEPAWSKLLFPGTPG